MPESQRREPDWQNWPGRPSGDEGVRNRLRALFVPTDAGDAIAELIAEHSRELESRAEELRTAVADLEQREARARELHARVEQVLREGSAELDVRHSDLVVRTTDVERREASVAGAEARVEERARALGAVELKAAALERREHALREREQALAHREQALRDREGELERRESEVAESSRAQPADIPPEAGHLAFAIDDGYRLLERDGVAPDAGDMVDLDGAPHRCVRVTVSPYPDDRRRCAVFERIPAQ